MCDNKIAASAVIEANVIIGNNIIIEDNVIVKSGSIIGNNVILEKDVYVDYHTIIRDNVKIGKNSFIGARSILGEYLVDFTVERNYGVHPLVIGNNALIRSETIIYGDSVIGENFQTGHRVTIREGSVIGQNVRIGTLSDVQGHCNIGNYVNMHSNVHIGQKSRIKDYVWIFPYVILTNDPNPPSEIVLGVEIEEFAVIATGSVVLPGVVIGAEALVGAGAVVTKNVSPERIVVGNPARDAGNVSKIRNRVTGEQVYPWKYSFDRGMPWEEVGYEQWSINKE